MCIFLTLKIPKTHRKYNTENSGYFYPSKTIFFRFFYLQFFYFTVYACIFKCNGIFSNFFSNCFSSFFSEIYILEKNLGTKFLCIFFNLNFLDTVSYLHSNLWARKIWRGLKIQCLQVVDKNACINIVTCFLSSSQYGLSLVVFR